MVHRPSDSRLLTNLLSHEKDYSKQLTHLLDASQSSLASFSAYASSSSPLVAQAILAVAGSFAGSDEALRRYAASVEAWRDQLKDLKDLEEEVGNIMRDREILVTRLIKVSKSQKPTRESLLINGLPTSSSSISLSAKSDFSNNSYATNSKLSSAQAELQACEAHLAIKERELDNKRTDVVRSGLSARCSALVECGWVWGEMGKEGLRALETLGQSDVIGSPSGSLISPLIKPLPDPTKPPSDLSSVAPSQSASQIAAHPQSPPLLSPHTPILHLDPPHAISDYGFPAHILPRRITEEDLHAQSSDEEEQQQEVEVVQNPRFETPSQKKARERARQKSFSVREQTQSDVGPSSPTHPGAAGRPHKTGGSGFFGSLRMLFGKKEQDTLVLDPESPTKRHGKKWETRTDRNLKGLSRAAADSDDDLHARAVVVNSTPGPSFHGQTNHDAKKKAKRNTISHAGDATVKRRSALPRAQHTTSANANDDEVEIDGTQKTVEWLGNQENFSPSSSAVHLSDLGSFPTPAPNSFPASSEGPAASSSSSSYFPASASQHQHHQHQQQQQQQQQQHEAGWTSDPATRDRDDGTVKRRKSTKSTKSSSARKSKDMTTLVIRDADSPIVPPFAAPSGGLSRNSSLRSSGTAPVQSTSTSASTSKSKSVPRRAMSEDGGDEVRLAVSSSSSSAKGTKGAGGGRPKRSATVSHPNTGGRVGESRESLMSIVEGVTKQNRDGWSTGAGAGAGAGSGKGGGVPPLPPLPPQVQGQGQGRTSPTKHRSTASSPSALPPQTRATSTPPPPPLPTTTPTHTSTPHHPHVPSSSSSLSEIKAPPSLFANGPPMNLQIEGLPSSWTSGPDEWAKRKARESTGSLEPLPIATPVAAPVGVVIGVAVAGRSSAQVLGQAEGGSNVSAGSGSASGSGGGSASASAIKRSSANVKMPLRSALRTPSPMPPAAVTSPPLPLPKSTATPPPAQAHISTSTPAAQAQAPQGSKAQAQQARSTPSPPVPTPAAQASRDKGKLKAPAPRQDDDNASIISETDQEVYESADEGSSGGTETETETELANTAAPALRAPTPQRAGPPLPIKNTLALLTGEGEGEGPSRAGQGKVNGAGAGGGGSDLSQSTGSTALAGGTGAGAGTSTIASGSGSDGAGTGAGDGAGDGSGVRRRKSVRVSLQPTFSPTPPAIEDTDEEEGRYAPWSGGASSGSASGGQAGYTSGGGGGGGGWDMRNSHASSGGSRGYGGGAADVDMWQDSSEEDEEYSRAKRLLSRVTGHGGKKKHRANGHAG